MLAHLRGRWSAFPFWSRLAIVVWVAVLGGVAGRVLFSKASSQTVVPIYRAAGERWLDSQSLYHPVPGLDVYRNPPGATIAFVPLAFLPPKLAGLAWRGLGAAIFLFGLGRFRRDVVPEWSETRAAFFLGLAVLLALPSINNGQVNLHLAGAALHGTAAAARGRWWTAALWFCFGAWLKAYPLALGLLVAVAAPLRLGPRLLLVAALGFALPFLLQDPHYVLEQHRGFAWLLGLDDRANTIIERVVRDWTVIPRTWFGWVVPAQTSLGVSILAGALAALAVGIAALRAADFRRPLVLALALGTVWMTVFGPATESNTYSLLAGVAAYLVVARDRSRWARALAGAGYVLLLLSICRGMFPHDWRFQVLGPQAIGAILLGLAALAGAAPRKDLPAPRIWLARIVRRVGAVQPTRTAGIAHGP